MPGPVRGLPVLPGDPGPLLADVAAQQRSAGGEASGDADRGVTGEGSDLDRRPGLGELREQGHEGALLGSDLQAGLGREQVRGLVGQLPQDSVRRAAVRGEIRVEMKADLLGAPRHGDNGIGMTLCSRDRGAYYLVSRSFLYDSRSPRRGARGRVGGLAAVRSNTV